ncbi:hypothetical protein FDECE_11297 [Fusarium decemcellulare]|nr:hypothetical protein FDECE_11297 [Fusarium decemcellulare]
MASYLVTGVSRGIGWEFLRELSSDPNNTVVGLVRNKAATEKRVAKELDRSNIHIVQADITNYDALAASVPEVSKITGGSLDCVIANAAFVPTWSAYDPLGVLGLDPTRLNEELDEMFKTNVIGNIHLFNLYVPLVRNGRMKKVITISTGLADDEMTRKYAIHNSAVYSMSKAAMNTAVAKFGSEHGKDGILFLAICPGMVDTGVFDGATEEQKKTLGVLMSKFQQYSPEFAGPATPEQAAKDVLSVAHKATLADGYGGAFVSHFGTKRWL